MQRCLINPGSWPEEDGVIALSAAVSRHVHRVMRLGVGDHVELFDGAGLQSDAVIVGITDDCVQVRSGTPYRTGRSSVEIDLIQAIPKGRNMDLVVEKCTELGVSRIWPVMTERCVVRLEGNGATHRLDRWRRIAEAAARQCQRATVPEVCEVGTLEAAVTRCTGGPVLVATLEPNTRPLQSVLHEMKLNPPGSVAMAIGPEGDFSPTEVAFLKKSGAIPVSFGPLVYRSETAALFSVGVLAFTLQTETV